MFVLTGDILKQIAPRLNRADKIAELLTTICPQYGINSADILHEYLANLCEESGEFTDYEENLYYSKPGRLMQVWPHRFLTIDSAIPFIKNPQKLGEFVYGIRKDLGNTQPGDGWNFRGSGPIQITGRLMFTLFAGYMRKKFGIIKTLNEWADLLRNNDEYGIHSASWLFAISKKLIDEAEADLMKTIVKKINGGYTNMERRTVYYTVCKKLIQDQI